MIAPDKTMKITARQRLANWLEENPDAWQTTTFTNIEKEAGVSLATVNNVLPELIAHRDGILPSEVMAIRKEHGIYRGCRNNKQPPPNIDHLKALMDEHNTTYYRDLAYLTGYNFKTVRKMLKIIAEELDK